MISSNHCCMVSCPGRFYVLPYIITTLYSTILSQIIFIAELAGSGRMGLRRFCKVLRLTRHSSHSGFRQRWKGWKEEVRKAKDRKGKEGDEKLRKIEA